MIRDTLDMFCFLILKDIICFLRDWHENKTINAKDNDSELMVYQTKNTARQVQQRDGEKTRLNQVQTTKLMVKLYIT